MPLDIMTLLASSSKIPGRIGTESDMPSGRNRYIGGHRRTNHPYISGYWYVFFDVPNKIFPTENEYKNRAEKWLHSSAEGFTPPSRTLSKYDIPGMGGAKTSFISGQEISNTFSITFREYQYLPLLSIFNAWTSIIDPHMGLSSLGRNEFKPSSYKGNVIVVLAKPTSGLSHGFNGSDRNIENDIDLMNVRETSTGYDFIEQIYYFSGVFPEGAPNDAFSSDISSNESAQLAVTFSFDGWVLNKEHIDIREAVRGKIIAETDDSLSSGYNSNFIKPISESNSPRTWHGK